MRAVIFANGVLTHPQDALAQAQTADLIIAADGGLRHLLALRLRPHVLIGDFDSTNPEDLHALAEAGVTVARHPTQKDATDLELALDHAVQRGATEVVILAAMGSRWDQSLANLLLAAADVRPRARIRLVDGPQEAQLVRAGETLELRGQVGDTVSLIPLGGDARGITTTGLEYPLKAGVLRFGSTRGVSNTLLDERGAVRLDEGLLLCLVIHGPIADLERGVREKTPADKIHRGHGDQAEQGGDPP